MNTDGDIDASNSDEQVNSSRRFLLIACMAVVSAVVLFALWPRASASEPKYAEAPALEPTLKVDLDMSCKTIRKADSFYNGAPEIMALVYTSREPETKHLLAYRESGSVLYFNELGVLDQGDEIIIEVYDEDELSRKHRAALQQLIASGISLTLRQAKDLSFQIEAEWLKDKEYRASIALLSGVNEEDLNDIQKIAGSSVVLINSVNSLDFLGKAIIRVPDQGLPSATFSNPVTILNGDKSIGSAYLYAPNS